MTRGTVIVGSGHAGSLAAVTLRRMGYDDPITLIGNENVVPYHRPPLSKGFLKRDNTDPTPLRAESAYTTAGITCLRGVEAAALDLDAKTVRLADGASISFDKAVLATGAVPRRPAVKGLEHDGVYTLRSASDARAVRKALQTARNAIVVGGGFIGFETAATITASGCPVTVVEIGSRVLTRGTSLTIAAHAQAHLERNGVQFYLGTGITAVIDRPGGGTTIVTSAGEMLHADLVVLGTGVVPDCRLAAAAGLACDDGILVDATLRTSHPDVFAIGDCARFDHWLTGGTVRLESVQNATDQARHAARAIIGSQEPYRAVPWFWSDIGDLKLQMVGLLGTADRQVLSGSMSEGNFSVYHFSGPRLVAVDSVNRPSDHMAARKLISAGYSPTVEEIITGQLPNLLRAGDGVRIPAEA
ncbi:NAD(P)/FAD-dependent oxidoreductase [Microvirga puerhi]|uniref:FAD-dependent oxidoreductase n=1 Tax=Microvirga puerhi TaxID=2876078 RepID=A0ABS7VUV4_9HYPH|nr:FAD-dependent oxidoreductase [Microvirga puerhi]